MFRSSLLTGYDRATSLYAGRLPAVTEVLDSSTLDLRKSALQLEVSEPYF